MLMNRAETAVINNAARCGGVADRGEPAAS